MTLKTQSSLYRARRKVTTKFSKTQQNIILEVEGPWTRTTTGEEFLLFGDGDNNRIITFATSQNLIDVVNHIEGWHNKLKKKVSQTSTH